MLLGLLLVVASANETTVQTRRPEDIDDHGVVIDDAHASPTPEDVLLRVLGGSLVHEGGPLAPTRPMIRGLAGARLGVSVDGLALTDPATGLLDAALLPWAASERVAIDSGASADGGGGLGGGVRLQLRRTPGVTARALAGSLSTVRASLAAASDAVLVAADAASTAGDFSFLPTSAIARAGETPLVRRNNDRQRASLLTRGRLEAGEIDVEGLVIASGHRGGIPGFSTSPTRGLRGEDGLLGSQVSLSRRAGSMRGTLSAQARAAHRSTFGPEDSRSTVQSTSARAEGALRLSLPLGALGPLALSLASGADRGDITGDAAFTRTAADALVRAGLRWGLLRLHLAADSRLTSDVGVLWGGEARAEMGESLRVSLGVSRASRAPTLDELYAPRGQVLGNPSLRPEVLHDLEVALAFIPGRVINARAVAFAGRIDEAIVYVNRNAYEIAPENLGQAWRAGLDLSMSISPHRLVGLEANAALLTSEVEATASPLPLAPPFSSRVALRAGDSEGLHGIVAARSRGAAPSNIFGTLVAAPYTLFDVVVRAPIGDALTLGVMIENALDVLDARDANLLPLPGRLFFFSLEVRA